MCGWICECVMVTHLWKKYKWLLPLYDKQEACDIYKHKIKWKAKIDSQGSSPFSQLHVSCHVQCGSKNALFTNDFISATVLATMFEHKVQSCTMSVTEKLIPIQMYTYPCTSWWCLCSIFWKLALRKHFYHMDRTYFWIICSHESNS